MKKLLFLLVVINVQIAFGQNATVIEVDKPQIPTGLKQLFNSLDGTVNENINILESRLKKAESKFKKHEIATNLSFLYAEAGKKEKNFEMWGSLNKEGISFLLFINNGRYYPPFLENYMEEEAFKNVIKSNNKLIEEASDDSKAEYFVSLPENYDPSKKYPLIMIFHGGIGSFYSTYSYWESNKLRDDYIAVYAQGKVVRGTFKRSFGQSGLNDVKSMYEQVVQKYSVNTDQVILAGQSAGGHLSIRLAYESIKPSGLLLAFPVKPREFDLERAKAFKEKGIKITMIYGAKDQRFFEGQSEFFNLIKNAEVSNQSFLYPELGHTFPKDFSAQIDKALVYLIK